MDTPILFICYKRYNYVKKTLKKILDNKPKILYISIDGGKNSIDELEINKTINVINTLLLEFNYNNVIFIKSNMNLGCDENIIISINKVFECENELIIIEDDILISKKFINFIENNKNKIINKDYICISNSASSSKIKDGYQFNCHGWYITKNNWLNIFERINILENEELFETIIKYVYQPSFDSYEPLKYSLKKGTFYWDECFRYNIFIKNKKILYLPPYTTKHIGLISDRIN